MILEGWHGMINYIQLIYSVLYLFLLISRLDNTGETAKFAKKGGILWLLVLVIG